MSQRFAKDKNIVQGLSVWIEGSLFCSVYVFFFFFLNLWPGSFPRKILGDQRQMNHDAEYDDVGISDPCFVKGFVYEELRSNDLFKHIWDTLCPVLLTYGVSLSRSDGEGLTRGPVLGPGIFR
jgi:hypothetical protein